MDSNMITSHTEYQDLQKTGGCVAEEPSRPSVPVSLFSSGRIRPVGPSAVNRLKKALKGQQNQGI